MKRILNLALVIAFQICFLEWPPSNSMFIFQGEYLIFSIKEQLIDNLIHPIILTGLIAQLILLSGFLLPRINKMVNTLGVILLGIVVLLFFVVGLITLNYKIALSTLPYLGLTIVYFVKFRNKE